MRTTDADRFAAYYAARYRALRRTAYLLCGGRPSRRGPR
jgi:hypothetical protein